MLNGTRAQTAWFDNNALKGKVSRVIIDEAHLIWLWGLRRSEDKSSSHLARTEAPMRMDYGELWRRLKALDCPVIAVSGSLPRPAMRQVLRSLKIEDDERVQHVSTDLYRPNLRLIRTPMSGGISQAVDAERLFAGRLDFASMPQSLHYSNTRGHTGQTLSRMHAAGKVRVTAESSLARRFHSNTSDFDKALVLADFPQHRTAAVAATSALGLGIDWNVSIVFQYGMCGVADLMQRWGRAGRDSRHSALCVAYSQAGSRRVAKGDAAEDVAMSNFAQTPVCLWAAILCYFEYVLDRN